MVLRRFAFPVRSCRAEFEGCLFGCCCSPCAQFIVRKRALEGNLENYICCQGYFPGESHGDKSVMTFCSAMPSVSLFRRPG